MIWGSIEDYRLLSISIDFCVCVVAKLSLDGESLKICPFFNLNKLISSFYGKHSWSSFLVTVISCQLVIRKSVKRVVVGILARFSCYRNDNYS